MQRVRRLSKAFAVIVAVLAVLVLSGVRPDVSAAEAEAELAPPPSRFVDVDGVRVHLRDEGSGPVLLLLHGTASSLHTWQGWADRLSSHRRVIRVDLPGYGLTGPAPEGGYASERYVAFVLRLLEVLHVEGPIDLAGNSFGGAISWKFALAHPSQVRALILVDAAGYPPVRLPTPFRIARTPVLGRLVRWVTPTFMMRKNVREVYGNPELVTDALVHRYETLLRREGNRQVMVERFNGPAELDRSGEIANVRVPTLILWGAKDAWIPLEFGERFHAAIPGSRMTVLPAAGHVPMEEAPDETARIADEFLTATATAGAAH